MSFHTEQFEQLCREEREKLTKLENDFDKMCDESKAKGIKILGSHTIWTTKKGTKIAIIDMTKVHLENTIKFLKRKIEFEYYTRTFEAYIRAMEKELEERE